jgi:hypothetical protein
VLSSGKVCITCKNMYDMLWYDKSLPKTLTIDLEATRIIKPYYEEIIHTGISMINIYKFVLGPRPIHASCSA